MPIYLPTTLNLQTLHQDLDSAPESCQTVQTFLERYVFPEALDPIFVHESHSIQYGSAGAPRVLLVTRDRRLTLTFSGKPNGSGWNAIEAMSVIPGATPRFQFAEMTFPKDLGHQYAASKHPVWSIDADLERRCAGCHSSSEGLDPVLPTAQARDQGVWGGTPAPWPQDLSMSWSAFSAGIEPSSRYAPLRAWIEGISQEQMSTITQDYMNKLSAWMSEARTPNVMDRR